MRRVWLEQRHELLFGQVGRIGSGGNSGFQALNLAAQFGATDIAFVGLDLGGEHWHGPHHDPNFHMNNPDEAAFERWRQAFTDVAPVLTARGIRVVNCSPISTLKCFPYMPLKEWCDGARTHHAA